MKGKSPGRLSRAIHKYGPDNFSIEVLGYAISKKDMFLMEQEFILELAPEYNMTIGGEGIVGVCRESIIKANEKRAIIRKNTSEEELARSRARMSIAQSAMADFHRANCRNWWAKATPEQKKKRLAGIRSVKFHLAKHSEETKRKMSDSHNARLLRLALEAVEQAKS